MSPESSVCFSFKPLIPLCFLVRHKCLCHFGVFFNEICMVLFHALFSRANHALNCFVNCEKSKSSNCDAMKPHNPVSALVSVISLWDIATTPAAYVNFRQTFSWIVSLFVSSGGCGLLEYAPSKIKMLGFRSVSSFRNITRSILGNVPFEPLTGNSRTVVLWIVCKLMYAYPVRLPPSTFTAILSPSAVTCKCPYATPSL